MSGRIDLLPLIFRFVIEKNMNYKRFGDLQIGERFSTASGGKIPVAVRIFQKISPTFAIDTSGKGGKHIRKCIALSMPVIVRNDIPLVENFNHESFIDEYDS